MFELWLDAYSVFLLYVAADKHATCTTIAIAFTHFILRLLLVCWYRYPLRIRAAGGTDLGAGSWCWELGASAGAAQYSGVYESDFWKMCLSLYFGYFLSRNIVMSLYFVLVCIRLWVGFGELCYFAVLGLLWLWAGSASARWR